MPPSPPDRDAFLAAVPVSRETLDRLDAYAQLIQAWNERLGLIAESTIGALWTRHFLDSAQLFPLVPSPEKPVLDMGTGAGFPGLILAIMGLPQVHLVEHNMRKVAFLRTVVDELGLKPVVHAMKVETVRPFAVGTVTARALKPLDTLIGLGLKFQGPGSVMLFPKGRRAEDELAAAGRSWHFSVARFPSMTDPESTVLRLSDLAPANGGAP